MTADNSCENENQPRELKFDTSINFFFKGGWVDFHPGGFIAVAIVQFIHHDKSELGKN